MVNDIHIFKVNKKRLFINLLLLIIGWVLAFFLIINPDAFISTIFKNETIIIISGIVGFLYFTCILISRFIFLFKTQIAIQVQNDFFIDHSSYESIGKINWNNVENISLAETKLGKKYIKIHINKNFLNQKFQNSNILKKALIILKNWEFRSEILIFPHFIEIDIDELYDILTQGLNSFKKSK